MENTPQKVVESHGKHTTEGRGQSWKTHHRRSWTVMENTPQKVVETPGKPPEMLLLTLSESCES